MTTARLFRLSGLALMVGMILSAVSAIGSGVAFPDNGDVAAATNPLNGLLSLIGVVGSIVALFGLPGMYARRAFEGGVMWLVGVVLISLTAMIFGIFLGLMGALVFPVLAAQAPDLFRNGPPPSFFPLFIIGTLANGFGALLMGIPMLTRGIYPRWCGVLLLVEAVLAFVGFAVNGPASSSSPIATILNVVSPLPLFVVLAWAGYELWSGTPAEERSASSVAVQPA